MKTLEDRLDVLEKATKTAIAAANEADQDRELTRLVKQRSELKCLRDQFHGLLHRVQAMEAGAGIKPTMTTNGYSGRYLEIVVTQGMLNQNLLTLSDALRARKVQLGDIFRIKALPSGDEFETELVGGGNKLRERGKIAKFYREAGVKEDDIVALKEVAAGSWELLKTGKRFTPPQYD